MKRLVLALLILLVPSASAWGAFHGDARNTGVGPDTHEVYGSAWWRVDLDAFVSADPLAVDDLVLIADRDGRVTALDGPTGAQVWQTTLSGPIHGTPVAASGRIFVADETGLLLALDLQSGAQLAETTVGATHGDLSYHENKVFVGTEDGQLLAFTSSLDLLWTFDTAQVGTASVWNNVTKVFDCTGLLPGKPIRAAPAIADGVVVFASMNHHVFAVDEHGEPDGTTALYWTAATGDVVLAAPVLAADRAFIASYDDLLRAIPLGTQGTDTCFGAQLTPSWSGGDGSRIHATPAWDGEHLILATSDGSVRALTAEGKAIWSYRAAGPVTASPVIANGYVLVATDGGRLIWLDLDSGNETASFQAEGPLKGSPALWGDATYVVTENGVVSRLAPGILKLPDWRIGEMVFKDGVLNVTVHNDGPGDAPTTILTVSHNGTEVGFAIVPPLVAGASHAVLVDVDLPAGTADLIVDVDPDDDVREVSNDNRRTTTAESVTIVDQVKDGILGLPLWLWIVAGIASLGGGGGSGYWFWWRKRG